MQNDFEDVKKKFSKGNKVLFTKESACLHTLVSLMDDLSHTRLTLWAFNCLGSIMVQLNNTFPSQPVFDEAVLLCRKWAQGDEKMPSAKSAILKVHAFAKTITSKTQIALCHALGQALSCVHVKTHAIGLPLYELSALVFTLKGKGFESVVQEKIAYYLEQLTYWQNANIDIYRFAKFMYK